MLPVITIDTRALSQEFDLTQQNVEEMKESVVKTVTKVVETSWREQAKKSLGSTRSQYLNSIIVSEEGRFANSITLVGTLPNMIEQGSDPFDIKKGFENSSKKTITRDKDGNIGWYLTIPFSFAQTDSLGESTKFTGVLPRDVASSLKSKQKKFGQKARLGVSDIPEEFREVKSRPELKLLDNTLIPEYQHKHSIYEGIGQEKKGLPVMSFRRVSNNSDDNSWIHSGIKAYNLAEKAIQDAEIPRVVGDVIDSYLDSML